MSHHRILMVTTYYPPHHLGGDALHVKLLSDELKKAGHEVFIIYLLDPFYLKRGRDKNKKQTCLDDHIFPIKSPFGILSIAKTYVVGHSRFINKKIKEIVDVVKPDIIHYHNIAGFGPSVFRIGSCFKIYTAHDYWLICPMNNLLNINNEFCNTKRDCNVCSIRSKRPPQIWRLGKKRDRLLNGVDIVIAPSKFMADVLKENGINVDIKIIPNFVRYPNNFRFKNNEEVKPFFLYVGLLERHKGILDLIGAFKQLPDLEMELFIVGRGSLKEKVLEESKKDTRIHVNGWVDSKELNDLFSGAKAVIIPSVWPENNPLVALEALSHGTPIIVSNNGGLPEIAEKLGGSLIFSTIVELKTIMKCFESDVIPSSNIFDIYEKYYSSYIYIAEYENIMDRSNNEVR